MKYRLLVVDVDGTLVGKGGTVSARDREAVTRALRAGIWVALSTGRAPEACIRIVNQLSLDGFHMFFDGAFVGNSEGKEVYARPLRKEVVRSAVEFARLNDIYLELYTVSDYFVEKETRATSVRQKFFGLEPTIVDFDTVVDGERIMKGELFVSSPQEEARARSFEVRFRDSLRLSWASTPAYAGVYFVNVVDPAVSKGKALEELASFLGVGLEEVMAVGDGTNDIPLLSSAGLAVAMGNAPDALKAVADHVTADVDRGGLAAAIDGFLFGE